MKKDRAYLLADLLFRQQIEWRLKGGKPGQLTVRREPMKKKVSKNAEVLL